MAGVKRSVAKRFGGKTAGVKFWGQNGGDETSQTPCKQSKKTACFHILWHPVGHETPLVLISKMGKYFHIIYRNSEFTNSCELYNMNALLKVVI